HTQPRRDRMDQIAAYRELICENISYDLLLQENPYEQDLIDCYVELMVETCCSGRETIRVNQEDVPTNVVRSRLLKLDKMHIEYVMECLRNNTTQVGNIRAYTLSALYNAPVTIGQYYASQVAHDMAQEVMP
ncbi:MAG: replication initiator A domain-containing protein, partial [Oscillospiraceae bacterium]